MTDVSEELHATQEGMRVYDAPAKDLGTMKETMELNIGDAVRNVELLKDSLQENAKLSTTVADLKSSFAAIQDKKHVMKFS